MANYETIKSGSGNIEIYENNILYFLDEFIEKNNIPDLRKESQSVWNAALIYIFKNTFKGRKKELLNTPDIEVKKIENNDISYINTTNNGAYNIPLITSILNIYIELCCIYDKEVSILGFSKLTGINSDTIYDWGNNPNQRPGSGACDIYKTLIQEREESLSAKLASGRANPVGILGILNRHYGWNMGQPRTVASQQATIEQIQEKYRALPQNTPEGLPEADFN